MKKLVFFIAVLLFLAGCTGSPINNSDKNTSSDFEEAPVNEETGETEETQAALEGENTEEAPAEPEGEKGYVIADGLRVRQNPNVDAPIVDALPLGTEIRILEKSEDKQRIGEYEDFWYRIKFGDRTGWCFGPYLSLEDELKAKIQARFDKYFSPEMSVVTAVSTLEKLIELTGDSSMVDMGVEKMIKLQKDIEYRYLAGLQREANVEKLRQLPFEHLNDPAQIQDADLRELLTTIRANGYHIYAAEGDFYLESDPQYFLQRFGSKLSKAFREYLKLKSVEVDRHFAQDAGLIISWNELSDRIAAWESFIQKYPDTDYAAEARQEYFERYLYFYVNGLDNSRLYDYGTGELKDELKKSYERYIAEYGDQPSGRAVLEFYNLLKKNNFKETDEVKEYAKNIKKAVS